MPMLKMIIKGKGTQRILCNKYYHLCVAFKSNSGFWLVNYTCEEKYKKELSDEFLVWSESIEL